MVRRLEEGKERQEGSDGMDGIRNDGGGAGGGMRGVGIPGRRGKKGKNKAKTRKKRKKKQMKKRKRTIAAVVFAIVFGPGRGASNPAGIGSLLSLGGTATRYLGNPGGYGAHRGRFVLCFLSPCGFDVKVEGRRL